MGADAARNRGYHSLIISNLREGNPGLVGSPFGMVVDFTAGFSSPRDVMQKGGSLDGFDINSFLTCEEFGSVMDPLDVGPAVR